MQPHTNTSQQAGAELFVLGQTMITPGAEEALQLARTDCNAVLAPLHVGRWGELSDDDVKENKLSLE